MTTTYHGTSYDFTEFKAGSGANTDIYDGNIDAGVFVTTVKADAIFYADRSSANNGAPPRVLTCEISSEARILLYDDELAERFEDTDPELVDLAIECDYDAIDFGIGGTVNTPGTILVLNLGVLTIN